MKITSTKRFEHISDTIAYPFPLETRERILNKRSDEGYELVSTMLIDDPVRQLHFYWKRPVNAVHNNTENLENRNHVDK